MHWLFSVSANNFKIKYAKNCKILNISLPQQERIFRSQNLETDLKNSEKKLSNMLLIDYSFLHCKVMIRHISEHMGYPVNDV